MTQYEQDIYAMVVAVPGIKAREIAEKLSIEHRQVLCILNGALNTLCYQDSRYRWHTKETTENVKIIDNLSDKKLSDLCRYYLNCLSLDESNDVSAFLTTRDLPNYTELSKLDFDEADDVASRLVQKVSINKNLTSYVGYPVMIEKLHSSRANRDYLRIAPVFLFAMDISGGRVKVSTNPRINMEVIRQYSSKDINSMVYELVGLEKELGLNEPDTEIDVDEMVARLQTIRQWQWREDLDPERLNHTSPITVITDEGIYNRAIMIVTERSPYTIGLESELTQLLSIKESFYKETALYKLIHPETVNNGFNETEQVENILEVLPLNSEQEQAIRQSLVEDITVVTGPPGTGKSQVVSDLLVNAAWRGESILFASKNNKAVDVVEKRVNGLASRPIMLRLGGNSYAYRLAEIIEGLLSHSADQADKDDYNQYKASSHHWRSKAVESYQHYLQRARFTINPKIWSRHTMVVFCKFLIRSCQQHGRNR